MQKVQGLALQDLENCVDKLEKFAQVVDVGPIVDASHSLFPGSLAKHPFEPIDLATLPRLVAGSEKHGERQKAEDRIV